MAETKTRRQRAVAVPKAAIEATERTPGGEALDDRPLQVGPRDAMNADQYDPEIDVVPGIEEKGFHTGLVRQPASPIGGEGELRGFEATGVAGDSKFAYGSLAHLKAAHNALEAGDRRYAGVEPTSEEAFDPERLAAAERKAAEQGPRDAEDAPRSTRGKTGADSFESAEKAADKG